MKKAITYSENLYEKIPNTRAIFAILAFVFISLFVFYVYLVNRTVLSVVSRQNTENQVSELSGQIGQMEFQDIGLRDNITMALATNYGLEQVSASQFLTRTSQTAVLSYNDR